MIISEKCLKNFNNLNNDKWATIKGIDEIY